MKRASLILLAATLAGCAEEPRPENVVIVVVDTLRADHLGAYGYSRDTTPALDELAVEARIFERALAPSPWTLPSFGSILSGRWPSEHGAGARLEEERPEDLPKGVKWAGALDPELPTLAEIAREAGLDTAAILNNSWLKPRMGTARGFDHYDMSPARNGWNRPGADVVDAALEWIDGRRDRRFLLVVHVFEPHLSYRPPPSVRGRFMNEMEERFEFPIRDPTRLRRLAPQIKQSRRDWITAVYDEEIAYVDEEIARFFDGLRERGLWNRSLVMLTADHGEELFDHGSFEHGHAMYDEVLRVPLVVWGPGVRAGREQAPVSLVDLVPTVLDALALPAPELSGTSLWPSLTEARRPAPRPLFADRVLYGPEQRAVVRWPYKLISRAGEASELYDLSVDPGETDNLASSSPDLANELLAELDRLEAGKRPATPVELDAETVRDLRSLGYIDGGDGP